VAVHDDLAWGTHSPCGARPGAARDPLLLVPGAVAAAGLRDALLEVNLPYLPRFVANRA
jgi:hypothetical protein